MSNHGDVYSWFPKHGKSMDDFRADVVRAMDGGEEDNMLTYKTLNDVPAGFRPTIRELMERGALAGEADPDPTRLNDNILNVSYDYCRIMTTLDRLGKLD